jgi:hypothetical protein
MKVEIVSRFKRLFFIFVLIAIGLSSCRTTRDLPDTRIKPMNIGRLLKKVEKNAFDYDDLSIRRISCRFSSNQNKANFSIRLKAVRDKKILVSIKKINIPVGRVLLTPDSVKYVNYINRNFFVDDYSFLSDFLNIDLDFETIQAILSNNAFLYRNDPKNRDFRTFDSSVESGMYLLQSEKERKIFEMIESGKDDKAQRWLERFGEDTLVLQKLYFTPRNFNLTKLIINDMTNERKVKMIFNDFEKVEKKDYPGFIEMNMTSPEDNIHLEIRMNGFSTEKIDGISLRIPEKYEQINVN